MIVGDNIAADWLEKAITRCQGAITAARSSADRMALVRSLARLLGGRLDLEYLPISLDDADYCLLARFGLARTNSDLSLRIVQEGEVHGLQGLGAALCLDPRSRQVYEPASPDAILLRLTSHDRYRTQTQKAATRALLTQPPGSGLLVSMPTGSGKSILFQIAANFGRETDPGACAIVVTPTIALALDHERTLSKMRGLEASRALTGDTPPAETEAIVNAFRRGEVPILLLSPEKALGESLAAALIEAAAPHSVEFGLDARLTHFFIDEAHIIETWGRSFRPDFQRLPALLARLRNANPAVKAVLLSATLPEGAREVLRASWKLEGDWLEIDARLPRYEHDIVVADYRFPSERDAALFHVIDRAPRPLIIYTTQISSAASIYSQLKSDSGGYSRVALFTGDTGTADRRRIVEGWADDEFDIVVATSAFGMGIDKADVRSVLHACLPEGPARWYQEIGRASRDGGQGLAVCLFLDGEDSDVDQAYGLATSGWLTRELAEQRWLALQKSAGRLDYSAENPRITVDLDAFREGLRPRAGDWNRGWNMTLLTLMQRAGVLRILSVRTEGDQVEHAWTLEILDKGLQVGVDEAVWERISASRNQEVRRARADLDRYVRAMRNPETDCVTRTAFEIIEPQSFAPACGRCPSCRAKGISPPTRLAAGGLERFWHTAPQGPFILPSDALLLNPVDPCFEEGLTSLVGGLAAAGIEQFVVPHGWAARVAPLLSDTTGRLGLILEEDELAGDHILADLPTAVLLAEHSLFAALLVDRVDAFRRKGAAPIILVARPEIKVRGRRLDQMMSRYAPYAETQLAALANIKE